MLASEHSTPQQGAPRAATGLLPVYEVLAVFPRQLERHLSNLKISLLVLPRMVEAILVSLCPHAAHVRPQLVSAYGYTEHGSGDRLLARLGFPRKVIIVFFFTLDVSPILDEI